MKKISKVKICIIAFVLIVVIGIVLDYTDVLHFISEHFNYDFLDIFIPNVVLIFIFFITYFLIDKRNMEKGEKINKNQLNILNIMIQKTFIACKKVLDKFINDPYTLEHYTVPSASSDKNNDIDIVKNFQDLPFNFDEQIMKMMYDGLVDKEIINKYLEIKDLYRSYVREKIDSYNLLQHNHKALKSLRESIEEDNKNLTNLLDEELKRVDEFFKE